MVLVVLLLLMMMKLFLSGRGGGGVGGVVVCVIAHGVLFLFDVIVVWDAIVNVPQFCTVPSLPDCD